MIFFQKYSIISCVPPVFTSINTDMLSFFVLDNITRAIKTTMHVKLTRTYPCVLTMQVCQWNI